LQWVAINAQARVAPRSADQRLIDADPDLYAVARAYFPSEATELPPRRIFRLTREQIDQSVASLLPAYLGRSVKEAMPKDPLQTNYEYADLIGLNAANWGALSGWIAEIAARVGKSPAALFDCSGGGTDARCLEAKARGFVTRAFRGTATPEKVEKLVQFLVSGAKARGLGEAAADLVEVVLNSPDFLFRKELDVDATGLLTPPERLETIAYALADVPPDRLGFDPAAAARPLATEAETRGLVEKALASPEARAKLARFFKAWLEIKDPGEFTISRETFPEFGPELQSAMLAETERFLAAELARPVPRLKDITQSTRAFVSKPLEAIYAVKAADAAGAKPIEADPAQRLGIFSQPAVIASHSGPTGTRLVKRGTFWVRKVMCMEMDPPPAGIDTTLKADAGTTERTRIEQVTAKRACIGCHKKIDPFGFLQENWDAIGRWRTLDNGFPIDAAIDIDFLDEEPVSTKGPVEALKVLTGSMMLKQCFVRQLFRYYMGRNEEPADDPLLSRMLFAFAEKDEQAIIKALTVMATDERMVRRR
jgi:hypothetical protein